MIEAKITRRTDGSTYISRTINSSQFQYDPNGYRIRKTTDGQTQYYYLEGEHLEAIYDGNGRLTAQYLRGAVIDEVVNGYQKDGNNKLVNTTYHHDALQSVLGQSGHDGSVLAAQSYGAFGNVLSQTGTGNNRLKYTGREEDSTGLYYYRARYYDPFIGRFISEDPLGFDAGDVNFYAYVGNNPVNANDPSGMIADILLDAGFIAYDIYSLVKNPGWDTAAALGLDVVGAAVPFVTGLGQTRHLTDIANRANNIPILAGTRANVAGTLKHSEAERLVKIEIPKLNTEVSYKGGTDVRRGLAGSVRLDVVKGPLNNPSQVFDFKFGQAGLSNSRINNIYSQVGSSNFPITAIRPGALPTRTNGFGATYNLTQQINDFFSGGSANGGFVLYPNKSNTNMMQSVYAK